MKSWQFIYSRRWLVILGLFVVAVSLGFVYLVKYAGTDEPATTQATNSEQNPGESPIPTTAIVAGETTWKEQADLPTAYTADTPEATAVATVNEVGVALASQDSQKLYSLLSSEIKDIFTVESVDTAMGETVGLALQPIGEIMIDGEWAEQIVSGTDLNGETSKFKVILRLEDGQWKLYGTTRVE